MEVFGLAIFASVVLYLAVTHTGFRKIVLRAGAMLLLCAIACSLYVWHRNRVREAVQAVKSIDFPITSLEFSPEQATKDTQTEQNGALAAYNNAYADLVHQCVYGRIQDVGIVDTEWSDDPYAAYGGKALPPLPPGYKLDQHSGAALPNFIPADPPAQTMVVKLKAVCHIEPQ